MQTRAIIFIDFDEYNDYDHDYPSNDNYSDDYANDNAAYA